MKIRDLLISEVLVLVLLLESAEHLKDGLIISSFLILFGCLCSILTLSLISIFHCAREDAHKHQELIAAGPLAVEFSEYLLRVVQIFEVLVVTFIGGEGIHQIGELVDIGDAQVLSLLERELESAQLSDDKRGLLRHLRSDDDLLDDGAGLGLQGSHLEDVLDGDHHDGDDHDAHQRDDEDHDPPWHSPWVDVSEAHGRHGHDDAPHRVEEVREIHLVCDARGRSLTDSDRLSEKGDANYHQHGHELKRYRVHHRPHREHRVVFTAVHVARIEKDPDGLTKLCRPCRSATR